MDKRLFTRLVINVVEVLTLSKKEHKLFVTKSELLKELHLNLKTYSVYKDGLRAITKKELGKDGKATGLDKHKHIISVLVSRYKVNELYLRGASNVMFSGEIPLAAFPTIVKKVNLESEDTRKEENEILKEEIKRLQLLVIELQQELINNLKKEKPA